MLNHNLRGVGTFYRCWHLAKELVRSGHEVLVFTVSPDRRVLPRVSIQDGLTIVETPNLLDLVNGLGTSYGVLGIPLRMLVAARRRADVIHAFDHKPNVFLPAMLARAFSGSPLVVDWADWWGFAPDGSGIEEWRGWPVTHLENVMEESIHKRADQVTTISTGLRDRALSLGIPSSKVRWIPSGAPIESIQPLDKLRCKEELGLPPSTFLIGFVGSGANDLDLVMPALTLLRRERPTIRLGLVGTSPRFTGVLGSESREMTISFGPIPFTRLPTYLGACDAFVLPLRDNVYNRTRWPNKFGDYLAAGRPVLCSDVGDVADIVRSRNCGFVWGDPTDFVVAVETLVDDEALMAEMGGRAREVAETRLSWPKLASEFLEVYRHAGAQG